MHKDGCVKNIISSISKNDFTEVIEKSECSWKETLAYMIAYEDDEKIKEVAKELGDQLLQQKKDINSAIVCYILAAELDLVTDLWKKRALFQIRKQGMDKNEALFVLIQKTLLLRTACKARHSTEDIDLILTDFAEFLNADQQQYIAMKFLQSSTINKPELSNLKNRIYYSAPNLHTVFAKPQPCF